MTQLQLINIIIIKFGLSDLHIIMLNLYGFPPMKISLGRMYISD